MKQFLLAIDVGGTKIEAAAVNLSGQTVARLVTDTDSSGPEGLLESIDATAHRVLAQAQATTAELLGVGLGVPGQVNPESGVVRLAVNLNLDSFPLAMALAGRLKAPVSVENDVRLAALGLYQHMQRQQRLESLAYVSVGTGIAAGIVIDGKLLRGANGMAGEIGHMVFDPQGDRCQCGLRGCLETIASGPSIARQAAAFLSRNGRPPSAGDVFAAAANGNEQAQDVVQRSASQLARALHWLVMSYDVERVVVSGGVASAGAAFWQPIETALSHLREQSTLANSMLPPQRTGLLETTENPGILGATILAYQSAGELSPDSSYPIIS